MLDYKHTLNLPHTKFQMKGNLVKIELEILDKWKKQNLYSIIRNAKQGKKQFILHDGPPYANGKIHIGHAVNKILKDIIIKAKGQMGFDTPFIPGWDCHGLPIELKVEQLFGPPSLEMSEKDFRKKCREYAEKQVNDQKKDFIRLGVIGDWNNPYLTMDFVTEANIIRALSKVIDNGYLYRGAKPVHWCTECRSALAETEVEYEIKTSHSIYITFTVMNPYNTALLFNVSNFERKISFIIWTTNPWTIIGNRAISINPDLIYCLVEVNGNGFIVAEELVAKIMNLKRNNCGKVLGKIKGKKLTLLKCKHPLTNLNIPIILDKNITIDMGTGVVHIAPAHGPEDYILGKKSNLEIVNVIDSNGCILPNSYPLLDGLQVFESNKIIIEILYKKGMLFHSETLKHNYPHCWRHKKSLIFRTTPQWFLNLDKHKLRNKLLHEIKKIKWIPSWSLNRIEHMIRNRPDWCISRQRYWGVPIPIFIEKKTNKLHPNTVGLMEKIAKEIETNGIQVWWNLDKQFFLGKEASNYNKVIDTLDVWFDSGTTNFSVLSFRPELFKKSSDLYLEGSDQHRGFFMSSLIISKAIKINIPYRKVLTHGFVVDKYGKKMSKSIGNVISPQQIINTLGSDILRLWVASTQYTNDMVISEEILKYSVDNYRRIRNTARFLLANLNDFNLQKNQISSDKMVIIDIWAVGRAKIVQNEIISDYENYDLHKVVKKILKFCSIDMGSFYFDIVKDRLYTIKSDSIARRSCQTAFFHIINALVHWIAPIISFTADEICNFIPEKKTISIFTEEWYSGLFDLKNIQLMNNDYWNNLFIIRNEVNKVIEEFRINKYIGSSLEANVILHVKPNIASKLYSLGNELCFLFITSAVYITSYDNAGVNAVKSEKIEGLKITISKAKGDKCIRCWHYSTSIGSDNICNRCMDNIYGVGEQRKFI